MQVISESAYSWMLFEDEGAYFLSVLCGGVAMYMIEFQLSALELNEYRAAGCQALDLLASKVQAGSASYQSRHLPHFSDLASVKLATEMWRHAHVHHAGE